MAGHSERDILENFFNFHYRTTAPGTIQHQYAGWVIYPAFFYLTIVSMVLYNVLRKWHLTYWLRWFPQSIALLFMGACLAVLSRNIDESLLPKFDSHLFSLALLPPIMLQAGLELHTEAFFNHLGTILTFAIGGTLLNAMLLSLFLMISAEMGLFQIGYRPIELLTYSNLMSAVDPVAVLAIFSDIGINKSVYFLVFGESLLNDAVVLTMHSSFTQLLLKISQVGDLIVVAARIIIPSFLSFAIGALISLLVAKVTRRSAHQIKNPDEVFDTPYVEYVSSVGVLLALLGAYGSYLTCEMLHLSGIIALIGSGLATKRYVFPNIGPQGEQVFETVVKGLSIVTEGSIFVWLGAATVDTLADKRKVFQDPPFALLSLLYCVIVRFLVIFALFRIVNAYFHRTQRVGLSEQFLVAWSGLRGAIAFALVATLSKTEEGEPALLPPSVIRSFNASALLTIMATTMLLGISTRALVTLFNIPLDRGDNEESRDKKLATLSARVAHDISDVIERVKGDRNYLLDAFHNLDRKWIQPKFITPRLRSLSPEKWEALLRGTFVPKFSKHSRHGTHHGTTSRSGRSPVKDRSRRTSSPGSNNSSRSPSFSTTSHNPALALSRSGLGKETFNDLKIKFGIDERKALTQYDPDYERLEREIYEQDILGLMSIGRDAMWRSRRANRISVLAANDDFEDIEESDDETQQTSGQPAGGGGGHEYVHDVEDREKTDEEFLLMPYLGGQPAGCLDSLYSMDQVRALGAIQIKSVKLDLAIPLAYS